MFPNPIYISENSLDPDRLDEVVADHRVEQVVLPNPYGSPTRLALYQRMREMQVPCVVVERGALPGSVYFDLGGFCAESSSYRRENWDRELTTAEADEVQAYVQHLRTSGATLEPQPNMVGGTTLRRRLFQVDRHVKVIFAAFQSESDTTTNFFCGDVGSYDNFVAAITRLADTLPPDWRLVYKNHPLTKVKIAVPKAVCVDDCHIGDLLEMANATAVINSGVGVLSIAYGKPVFHFGQAFYACPGLTYAAFCADDVLAVLREGLRFDDTLAQRFIKFLVKDFYSFATWTRKERPHTDKAIMSISVDIRYQRIAFSGRQYQFSAPPGLRLRESMLFDRYRLDDYLERKAKPQPQRSAELGAKSVVSKPAAPRPAEPGAKSIVSKPAAPAAPRPLNTEVTLARARSQDRVLARKLNKLVRTPKQFFVDALRNRIQ